MQNAIFTLHPATDDDFEQVLAWRREAYRGYVDRWFGGWDEPHERAHLRMRWHERDVAILRVDGSDAGVLDTAIADGELLLGNLIVAPAARGRGLGTAVLRSVLSDAARRGLPVHLQVFQDNPARRLYSRLGFVEWTRVPPHVRVRWTPPAGVVSVAEEARSP
jgi:GNAT superfamily N-acetyltransferase